MTHGIIAGRVITIRDHPNGDHIWLADVDIGDDRVQIVWGGKKIVQPGDMVPVALPGARVHGRKMRRKKFRGQVSHGMLCSLAELGWDDSSTDRVAILARDLVPGMPL